MPDAELVDVRPRRMTMTDFVSHLTDNARLPWILRSAELRPGANRIGGYPDPDFVWATINKRGSRKAAQQSILPQGIQSIGPLHFARHRLRALAQDRAALSSLDARSDREIGTVRR